jgi:hypothetical protein
MARKSSWQRPAARTAAAGSSAGALTISWYRYGWSRPTPMRARRAPRSLSEADRAASVRRPRTRYTIGRDAALITRLTRILPDRTLDRVISANLRRHYPKAASV